MSRRIVVVGGPGSGKSTLAAAIAERLFVAAVELDALWWGPAWTAAGADAFTGHLRSCSFEEVEPWVVEGNYFAVGADVVWSAADTLVWLDLPRRVAVWRALRRSGRRIVRRTPLWNGNRQAASTLTPWSIARLIRRWPSYSQQIGERLASGDWTHLAVVRLRSDEDVRRFLASV